jgi:Skp family chaperone for outer membrane proteins
MKRASFYLSLTICILASFLASAIRAQNESSAETQEPQTVVVLQSAILTIDPDRLFASSMYGQKALADIRADSILLAAENREIEAALSDEELELTQLRTTLSPEEFRPLANAFDEKAQRIRVEQTAKANEIRSRPEIARQEFMRIAQDILVEIMQERRALAIFSNDAVFLVADTIDVTDVAIERINSLIGDGSN